MRSIPGRKRAVGGNLFSNQEVGPVKKTNFFKIGIFVICAIAVAVALVIILGGGALFRHELLVESYFVESVQGLGAGSAFTFRGVLVGHVKEITLTENVYKTSQRYVLVRSSLLTDVFRLRNGASSLEEEVRKGLRVRLALQGLTGSVYLEADYMEPASPSPLEIDWKPQHPYIPSVPSTVTRVSDALESLMKSVGKIDIGRLTEDLEKSLDVLSTVMQGVDIKAISKQAEALLSELRGTNTRIAKLFSGDLEGGVKQMQSAFRDLSDLISGRRRDIEVTLNNFRAASQNLREITENAKRYPSQLFFGEPPPHSGK